MIIIVILGEISDRIVVRIFSSAHRLGVETLQSLLTFAVMIGCYRLVITDYRAALVSALVATITYVALSPVINRLDKAVPKE